MGKHTDAIYDALSDVLFTADLNELAKLVDAINTARHELHGWDIMLQRSTMLATLLQCIEDNYGSLNELAFEDKEAEERWLAKQMQLAAELDHQAAYGG